MHSETWISLLRRIPLELHSFLVVRTSIGTEITVQSIVRMEEEYLVVRGRLSGSTDAGRIFFIPFAAMNHVLLHKDVQEAEIQEFCGPVPATGAALSRREAAKPITALEKKPAEQPAAAVSSLAETPPSANPAPAPAGLPVDSPRRMPIPSKDTILERLRARVHGASGREKPSS